MAAWYPLFVTVHLLCAVTFGGAVIFEVLILESLHRRFSSLMVEEFPGIASVTTGPGEILLLCFEEQQSRIATRVHTEEWFGSLREDVSFRGLFTAI